MTLDRLDVVGVFESVEQQAVHVGVRRPAAQQYQPSGAAKGDPLQSNEWVVTYLNVFEEVDRPSGQELSEALTKGGAVVRIRQQWCWADAVELLSAQSDVDHLHGWHRGIVPTPVAEDGGR